MRSLVMVTNQRGGTNLPALIVGLAMGLASLCVPVSAQNNTNDGLSAAKTEMVNNYEAAKAAGKHAAAAKYVLDYMEETEGKNAPLTVAMTQRYGNLLRNEGDIREAVSILKKARERGGIAFGEHAIELFEINLNLGEAYVDRDIGIGKPQKYFDYALVVLRKTGHHDTTLYVRTLVGVVTWLTQAGALEGAFSSGASDVFLKEPGGGGIATMIGSGLTPIIYTYESGYGVLQPYMQEAVELAGVLDIEDPYLSAKVAIVQARLKVTETVFREMVMPIIRGGISGITAQEYRQREDSHLSNAIDVLMADAVRNHDFLDIANSARMDIAWLSKDMQRMVDFCINNTLNMTTRYSPDRLFEVTDDGSVIAPNYSFRTSSNIFIRPKAREHDNWGPNQRPAKVPYFIPVCIDGRLMAVLINAPRVTMEEIRR
jgi:hypothetical protein